MAEENRITKNVIVFTFVVAILTALGTAIVDKWLPGLFGTLLKDTETDSVLWINVNRENKEPVGSVQLSLWHIKDRQKKQPSHVGTTDRFGSTQFEDVSPGWMIIEARHSERGRTRLLQTQQEIAQLPHKIELAITNAWIFERGIPVSLTRTATEVAFTDDSSVILDRSVSVGSNKWLSIAFAEIGVAEFADASANPKVIEYLKSTNLSSEKAENDETPWNSAFVNWVIEKAGIEGTGSAVARSWLEWGEPTSGLKTGCIAVLKKGRNPWGGHVGFVVGRKEGEVMLLGGNQRNEVNISAYSEENFLECRWPKGAELNLPQFNGVSNGVRPA